MAFTQFTLDIATEQSRGIFNQYVYKTTDTVLETQVAGYFAQSRFIDSDPDWIGSLIICECIDGLWEGQIGDGGTVTPVSPAGAALPDGSVPQVIGGAFVVSGANVDPTTGEWTFDKSINVPQASLNVSDTLSISEATFELFVRDHVAQTNAVGITSVLDDTGSQPLTLQSAGVKQTVEAQPIFNTEFNTNPFIAPLLATNTNQTDAVTIKTNAVMTNVRMTITDNVSGIIVKYIPDKAAVTSGTGGLDLISGDNRFDFNSDLADVPASGLFYLGFTPLRQFAGQASTFEIEADSVSLLGEPGGIPYLKNEIQFLTAKNIPLSDILTDKSVPFADSAGELTQDNANFNYDTASDTLTVANLIVPGDAIVEGTVTIINTENLSVADSYIDMNAGDTAVAAKEGGLVVNYLPTATNDTVTAGAFVAGIPSTSNPTVTTDTASVFVVSDIIQITGTNAGENDGTYEVFSHVANVLTIRGVGLNSTVESFSRNQFTANASDNATITKINVSVIRAGTDGVWEQGKGSETGILFTDLGGLSGIDDVLSVGQLFTANRFINTDTFTLDINSKNLIEIATLDGGSQNSATFQDGAGLTLQTLTGSGQSSIELDESTLSINMFADGATNILGTGNGLVSVNAAADSLTIKPDAAGTSLLSIQNASGVSRITLIHDDSIDFNSIILSSANNTINANAGSLMLQAQAGNLDLESVSRIGLNSPLEFADGSTQIRASVPGDQELRVSTLENNFVFDISSEITNARGSWMSQDGLKYYSSDVTTQAAYEYDLTIPFDISTMVYSGNSLVDGVNMTDFFLKPDGTSCYFVSFGANFREYPLSTPFDLSTAGSLIANNTTATIITSVSIMDNGTDAYFLQNNAGNGNVLQWVMSTPWDLSTLTDTGKSFVSGQADSSGLWMAADRKAYFIASNLDDEILQFSMATAGDITTSYLIGSLPFASGNPIEICISSDGKNAIITPAPGTVLEGFSLGLGSAGKSVFGSVSADLVEAGAVEFIEGSTQTKGTVQNVVQGTLLSATAQVPVDTSAQDTIPNGLTFTRDGLTKFVIGNDNNIISEYALTDPWDDQTSTFVQSLSVVAQDDFPQGLTLSLDENSLFMVGTTNDSVYRYSLPTAGSLTGATFEESLSVLANAPNPLDISIHPDGKTLYICNAANGVVAFDLVTPNILLGGSYSGDTLNTLGDITTLTGLEVSDTGETLYLLDGNDNTFHQWVFDQPWQILTAHKLTTPIIFTPSPALTDTRTVYVSPQGHRMYTTDRSSPVTTVGYDLGVATTSIETKAITSLAGLDITTADPATLNGFGISRISPVTTQIFSTADLEDLATAGTITVSTPTILVFKAAVTTATVFDVQAGGSLTIIGSGTLQPYVYIGAGTLFTSRNATVDILNMQLINAATGTLFDVLANGALNNGVAVRSSFLIGWALGSIGRTFNVALGPGVTLNGTSVLNWTSGLSISDAAQLNIDDWTPLTSTFIPNNDSFLKISTSTAISLTNIRHILGNLAQGDSLFNISAGTSNTASFLITGCTTQGGVYFDTTGGSTGTFTNVVDASFASEAITNVNSDAGTARFSFSAPPTLFVGQQITITGFVINPTYNGTFIITNTGGGFFECGVDFVAIEPVTGSFVSDTITLTDTATTLVNGDTLVIDTDGALSYDGGATVYNKLTNSFQINRLFDADAPITGTWNTASIDQTDPRVLATNNPGTPDSSVKAEISVIGNALTTNIPAANARVMINASSWTSQTEERIKTDADGDGIFFGNEPSSAKLDGNILLEPSSSTKAVSCQFARQDSVRNVVTFTNGTNLVNETGTPLIDGDNLTFHDNVGTLPAELRVDIVYFVVSATANTFQVSYTSGGAAVAFTDNGSGTNSYAMSDLHGSRPSEPIQANNPRTLVPQALEDVSKGDKTFIVISNDEDAVDIVVVDAYYRIVV